MSKITLFLKQNLPFASVPLCANLDPEQILCNDVTLPGDFNIHNTRLWVVGNEYGPMGAVWAHCEQDAIDELIDKDLANGILVEDGDCCPANCGENGETCEHGHGGNASEAYDTEHLWMGEVIFEPVRDLITLLKFAEARGSGKNTLDF